jgi:hypothetical protein
MTVPRNVIDPTKTFLQSVSWRIPREQRQSYNTSLTVICCTGHSLSLSLSLSLLSFSLNVSSDVSRSLEAIFALKTFRKLTPLNLFLRSSLSRSSNLIRRISTSTTSLLMLLCARQDVLSQSVARSSQVSSTLSLLPVSLSLSISLYLSVCLSLLHTRILDLISHLRKGSEWVCSHSSTWPSCSKIIDRRVLSLE